MSQGEITALIGRRVWDSRGNPTVEVEIAVQGPTCGRAIAPAGASRGSREASDLRDGGSKLGGLDVQKALHAVNQEIAPSLIGMDVFDQAGIDALLVSLDGTPLKTRLGGNALVATSLAVLHAAAASSQLPLWQHISETYAFEPSIPLPEIQIFGGGAHAGKRTDVQDFMIMVPGAASFDEALEVTAEVYRAAGSIMKAGNKQFGVADEGGWWPQFDSNEQALETLVKAIELAGEKPGDRVVISLDVAASEFGSKGNYQLSLDNRVLTTEAFIDLLGDWLKAYPIASIEDPLAEDDTEGMVAFTSAYGDRVQVIGDDYLVTNATLLKAAMQEKACNGALIKVNQVGTVSESIETYAAARKADWSTIVSARSGESEDVSICHLSVGLGAGQLKVGSFARSERMAKWNECLRIAEAAGDDLVFAAGTSLEGTWWSKQ